MLRITGRWTTRRGMIHQHFKLVDVLTVTENIILGLNEKGKLNIRAAAQKIDDICKKYGFDLDPMAKIYDLSVSQKQTVEIVKVLFRGAEILILDEPTAVLTPQETDRLFQVVRNMRADGKAIVLITHKPWPQADPPGALRGTEGPEGAGKAHPPQR